MHNAAYDAIKGVSARNKVLIGGLASDSGARPGPASGIAPLRFVRELACIDRRLRPLKRAECRHFQALRADGFSQHPYSGTVSPAYRFDRHPDWVTYSGLDRLTRLLGALYRRGRFAKPLRVHITEYGVETRPPDPRGVGLQAQARYLAQASYLAWRNPRIASFAQFLLTDIGPDARYPSGSRLRWDTWQTGLAFADGRPKPAAAAFRLPFWVQPAIRRDGTVGLFAFGQVRPGEGPAQIELQVRVARHTWQPVDSFPVAGRPRRCTGFASDGSGTFARFLPWARPGTYRFLWRRPPGTPQPSPPRTVKARSYQHAAPLGDLLPGSR